MFEAKIDANILKGCIESITAIVDEGKLRIAEDGLKLRAVDPANVAMVSFELQSDAFDDFRFTPKGAEPEAVPEGESTTESQVTGATEIGIDFVKLLGILGIGGK